MESDLKMSSSTQEITPIVSKEKSHFGLYFAIQMFLSFAQNLAFQYLPLYNRKLGATETQMGLLTSVQNVFSTVFSPFWGRLSDKHGRKIFLLAGGFIAMASATTLTLANTPTQVIISVGINAFGLSMLIPSWQGAIADYTEGSKRGGFMGRIMGVSYAYVTIALTLYAFGNPLLPITEIEQYRLIMGISAVNFLFVILCSWLLIDLRETEITKQFSSIFLPLKDATYRKFLSVILIWWFFMSIAWSYFPIVISDIIDATPSEVAWIAITATIIQAISSYRLADSIDKIGSRRSIIVGFISFSIVPLVFAFATEWWHLIPAQIVAGVGIGFGFSALQTYILDIAGSDRAGNYQGIYNLLWGGITFVGSFMGGVVLGWFKNYLGSLGIALTYLLLVIAVLRFLTNFIMIFYLPEPISSMQSVDE